MQPIWSPSEQAIEQAQITQFARQLIRKHKLDFNTYPEFYQWTVDHLEEFWSELWDWCGVIASKKGGTVLVDAPGNQHITLAQAKLELNYDSTKGEGLQSFSGSVQLPFPDLGFMQGVSVDNPVYAAVGDDLTAPRRAAAHRREVEG